MPCGYYGSVRIEDGMAIKRVKREEWAAAEAAYGQQIMSLPNAAAYFVAPTDASGCEMWMPYGGMTLAKGLKDHHDRRQIAIHLLAGLSLLHAHNICHGDIKDTNIVIDVTGTARFIDFWRPNAGRMSKTNSAPEEYWLGPHKSPAVDCFRLGIILNRMLPNHSIIQQLLDTDPSTRITAQECHRLLQLV